MGTILIITFVAGLLAFTLATASTYQLRVSQTLDSQAHARNLAESVINLAMARLAENPEFGKSGESLEVPLEGQGRAVLTFDETRATSLGVTVSTYNLDSKEQKPANGMIVPGESVRLVGLAQVGQAQVEVECVYLRPAFPIAFSCGDSLQANGLYLGGLVEGETFPGSVAGLTPSKTRPADLVSNGNLVSIDTNSEILGDVSAVGEIQVAEGATVRGAVRSGVSAAPLPRLRIDDIVSKFALKGITAAPPQPDRGGPANILVVDCYNVHPGDLTHNGDIELIGGVLHVQGDLRVSGEVRGGGMILVDGQATLKGNSSLDSAEAVNVICQGSLTLQGTTGSDRFRGLYYCDGGFRATDALILGSAISHGQANVTNVDLVHTSSSVSMSFGIPGRYENGDDTLIWRVDPVRDPESGVVTFNYVAALYYAPWVTTIDKTDPTFLGIQRGRKKTSQQVIDELRTFGNSDYQAEQSQYHIGDRIAADLPQHLAALSSQAPPEEVVISLDVNRLLAPAQRNRVLLWRYRQD